MTWWIVGFASWLVLGIAAAMAFGRFVRFVDAHPEDNLDLVLLRARAELANLVNRQRITEPPEPALELTRTPDRRVA
jgi:hypothetical protein